MAKRVVLRLSSNIERYEVTVYDGCNQIRKQVTGRDCLCLCTRAPYLRVVATPQTANYSDILYFWVDSRPCVADLYFHFTQTPSADGVLHRFTLTDATYGLPIDGTLFFVER